MKIGIMTAALCALGLFGSTQARETLHLEFDKAQSVELGGKTVRIDGAFSADGFLPYGKKGLAIPAATLAEKQGTILFRFRTGEFQEPKLVPRYLLTLRTKSRMTLGIYTFAANPQLNFSFTDQDKKWFFRTPEKLQPGRSYYAALCWDGEFYRVYLDGKLLAEVKQPLPVEKIADLNIGPYRDGWQAPKAWADDCSAGSLKVYDHALTPAEIAAACGIRMEQASSAFAPSLTVPRLVGAAPKLDGTLDDRCWNFAASMPVLTHGRYPERSGELPSNAFLLTYDQEKLYLGFRSIFPDGAAIKTGALRTPDKEPEVWGDESFEFYIALGSTLYRFAGNVAGGYTEWRGTDASWNGAWSYRSTLKMLIDNTRLWQGTAAIPWRTLGLDAPPAGKLKFNFCRTWRLPELSTHSSLIDGGQYNKVDEYVRMNLVAASPVVQFLDSANPAPGALRYKLRFASGVDAAATCRVELLRADGSAAPLTVGTRSVKLQCDIPQEAELDGRIASPAYNRICYTLTSGPKLLMRQLQPFKLNEEYLSVTPRFLAGKVLAGVRLGMVRAKFGADTVPVLRINGPDGKRFAKQPFSGELAEIAFARKSAPGEYTATLLGNDGKILDTVRFHYPGIGEWERMTFDNRIIPPFTPLAVRSGPNALECTVWNRVYRWKQSLLPVSIRSGATELLSVPAELEVNGKPLTGASVSPVFVQDHRAEFKVSAANNVCRLSGDAWIEYDGVQFNRFRLQATQPLHDVKLKLTLPAELAKYLHTSDATTSWGGKLTVPVTEGERIIRYYPTLWLGKEDRGICFFAESRADWKSPARETYRIVRQGGKTVLEVNLAGKVGKGETFDFAFGLLASPVRPLPPDYPLNAFSYSYAAPLNRPGHMPTSYASFLPSWPGDIDGFFGDLPNADKSPHLAAIRKNSAMAAKFGSRPVPYGCDRYLSEEYPEVVAFKDEWKISPELTLGYNRDGRRYALYDCCPTTGANAFYMTKLRNLFKNAPSISGSYFDFGLVPVCNNALHGCKERVPLLAQREFYRRVALIQLDAGIKEPLIVLHNTDAVQLPAMTFATHLFNGEHIRQHSSPIMHNGKDILDTYGIEMFASELNSLPFGLTNSVYQANDVLMKEFGGGNEDPQLYKFRITQAMLAGTLPHNTMVALNRCHFGIFDKIYRIYESFGVPQARFTGYWDAPAQVVAGKDIYVSVYCHQDGSKALAVISHIGKGRETQQLKIAFEAAKLGFTPRRAKDLLNADDPAYAELWRWLHEHRVPIDRTPLKLGDFGSKLGKVAAGAVELELKPHTFALLLLE